MSRAIRSGTLCVWGDPHPLGRVGPSPSHPPERCQPSCSASFTSPPLAYGRFAACPSPRAVALCSPVATSQNSPRSRDDHRGTDIRGVTCHGTLSGHCPRRIPVVGPPCRVWTGLPGGAFCRAPNGQRCRGARRAARRLGTDGSCSVPNPRCCSRDLFPGGALCELDGGPPAERAAPAG